MKRSTCLAVLIVVLAVSLSGCHGMGMGAAGVFNADGIPHERYLVGGGLMVDYTAPSDGTVYFADTTAGKLIKTQSVEEGETFEGPGSIEPDEYEEVMGSPLREAKFKLYFVPSQETSAG